MFIRESKTINKKTGEVYVKHQLVASVRTSKGPRNRIIMSLGTLTIPRIDWKRLAHALECRITGQTSLLEEHDTDLELLALKLVSNYGLSKALEATTAAENEQLEKDDRNQFVPIDLNSVKLKNTKGLGAEVLCMKTWDLLGLSGILRKLKISVNAVLYRNFLALQI